LPDADAMEILMRHVSDTSCIRIDSFSGLASSAHTPVPTTSELVEEGLSHLTPRRIVNADKQYISQGS